MLLLRHFTTRLSWLLAWVAIVALIGMMLLVTADAVIRLLLSERIPLTWVIGDYLIRPLIGDHVPFVSVIVANYMMVAIAFLPLGLAEMQDRNISVDLMFGHLPAALQRIASIAIHLFAAITASGLAWKMWTEAMRRFHSGTVSVEDGAAIPIWFGYFLLPAGFSVLALTYLLRVLLGLTGSPFAQAPLIEATDAMASEELQ